MKVSDPTNAALIISVVGILVSGVVGPQLTALATRRGADAQFRTGLLVERRDDLRSVVDEAARLLAPGATNLRLLLESLEGNGEAPTMYHAWASEVFVLGQRLRLRLDSADPVVAAYDSVRESLVEIAQQAPGGKDAIASAVDTFEAERERFLREARAAINLPSEGEVA